MICTFYTQAGCAAQLVIVNYIEGQKMSKSKVFLETKQTGGHSLFGGLCRLIFLV